MPILFVRPDWGDTAMKYASSWLGLGVEEARKRGYGIIDLYGADATKEKIVQTIQNEKPEVAILGGHGNGNTYTAQELEVIMQACSGDEVMAGTISNFLSCSVGQELLPSIVKKGGIWTVGYQVDFQFIVDTNYPVESDPYAEPFRDVTLTVIKKILDGGTLKEVWDAGIAKCDWWIAKLWSKPETQWGEVISCLTHDRDGMIALGNKETYVLPPKVLRMSIPQLAVLGLIFAFLVVRKP
jgi:hypothetical protein